MLKFRSPILLFLLFFVFGFQHFTNAQGLPSGSGGVKSDRDFSFVPIPYINYSRSVGFSMGAIPMAMYNLSKKDTISPSSISGLIGMYTTNDSWFLMGFNRFYLKEDTWRVTAAGGLGSINFQFFLDAPIGGYIDYNTQADFVFLEVQRKIKGKLYGGVHYVYTKFNSALKEGPEGSKKTTQNGVGFKFSFDKRNDVYYPTSGMISEIDWNSYPSFLSNDSHANKVEISHNQYWKIKDRRDVLAARFYTGFGIGDLVFEQQFIVGREDIRGYSQGKFRGNGMIALQGEYRFNFHEKLGAVGFFGLASVFDGINEVDNETILPGFGCGLRYLVFPKNKMNAGIDIAKGKDDWGFYFRVGEAF
ncbi:BamA/TamA family outer membrane protein [Flexithrix dorotheae]|uniref:BamA/TamA family outer membrane protein n=1 Tax=Flexithrix dorotheae TaxID=70993 RepID=UPI00035FA9D1|nr:BamA/TamA family outer membrane protein [Flexithrix dorotheae]